MFQCTKLRVDQPDAMGKTSSRQLPSTSLTKTKDPALKRERVTGNEMLKLVLRGGKKTREFTSYASF